MSNLIVVAFDDPNKAVQVAADFTELQKSGGVHLNDMMVVVKDNDGKIQIKDKAGHPVAWGAVIGGVLGGLLFLLVPVFGAIAGAAIGAAVGHWAVPGVDRKFVTEVGESIKPNSSAIFLLVSEGNETNVVLALKPYQGKLLQTNVSTEVEEQLKRVVEKED